MHFSLPSRQILYFNQDRTSYKRTCYELIVNNKIVECICTDAEIAEISAIAPMLTEKVVFFEKFDEFCRTINAGDNE
jgi:UDP-glucose 6-dehydrogenase